MKGELLNIIILIFICNLIIFSVINLNGNLVQVAGVNGGIQSQQVVNQPNIVMVSHDF